MLFFSASAQIVILIALDKENRGRSILIRSDISLGVALVPIVINFAIVNENAVLRFYPITLVSSIALGMTITRLISPLFKRVRRTSLGTWYIIQTLFATIAIAATGIVDAPSLFVYKGLTRWSGPWSHPNTCGLLMAAGACLGTGLGFQQLIAAFRRDNWRRLNFWRFIGLAFCSVALLAVSRALLYTYSRGAWLACAAGLGYFLTLLWRPHCGAFRGLAFLAIGSVSLVLALMLVAPESSFYSRLISCVNISDPAIAHRITALVGGFRMIRDSSIIGVGWNNPINIYRSVYMHGGADVGVALLTNDIAVLAITNGLVAVAGITLYVCASLFSYLPAEMGLADAVLVTSCRAGSLAFLCGFVFDGGMFKIETAVPFWTLLELSRFPSRGEAGGIYL